MEHTGVPGFSAVAISFDLPLKQVSSHSVERCALAWSHPRVVVTEVSFVFSTMGPERVDLAFLWVFSHCVRLQELPVRQKTIFKVVFYWTT